jgi:DNA-binding NarL/FixJ family response regulator
MPLPIRILVIDPQELVRAGIRAIAGTTDDIKVAAEASDVGIGLEEFRKSKPEVVLLALRFPDSCAIDVLPAFFAADPAARIIVIADHAGDAEIANTLKIGAKGYLSKDTSSSQLLTAIRAVAAGRRFIPENVAEKLGEHVGSEELTQAELNILRMLVGGMSNKEIAFALDVSENTVKSHLRNIFGKLAVSDRVTAVTTAIRRGLVRVDL